MACVELLKDAEGREIPLDTEVMYDINGKKVHINSFTYYRKKDRWEIETDTRFFNSTCLYLTALDSWEKLEEDLDRCIKADSLCEYSPSEECSTCVLPRGSQCHCDSFALGAIKDRIRKLRGED